MWRVDRVKSWLYSERGDKWKMIDWYPLLLLLLHILMRGWRVLSRHSGIFATTRRPRRRSLSSYHLISWCQQAICSADCCTDCWRHISAAVRHSRTTPTAFTQQKFSDVTQGRLNDYSGRKKINRTAHMRNCMHIQGGPKNVSHYQIIKNCIKSY